jgi:hypothetical protein
MVSTAELLPPVMRDTRGIAFAAALDASLNIDPWLSCPLAVSHAPDVILWELARQFDVAGPLYQAMKTRERKEKLVTTALRLQRKRGTPWSVEEIMRLLGFTDAKVLDRVNWLLYDGEAIHDGIYLYDGGINRAVILRYGGEAIHDETYLYDGIYRRTERGWADYTIRLYIDDKSREFGDLDRAEAAMLADDWAPLRSVLAGWEPRHLTTSVVDDPLAFAESVWRVILMDGGFGRQVLKDFWVQLIEDGNYALRWRLRPEDLTIPEVRTIVLIRRDGSEIERVTLPVVRAANNVFYEGYWRIEWLKNT